jgi:OmpA-OmpF porin, OOP family
MRALAVLLVAATTGCGQQVDTVGSSGVRPVFRANDLTATATTLATTSTSLTSTMTTPATTAPAAATAPSSCHAIDVTITGFGSRDTALTAAHTEQLAEIARSWTACTACPVNVVGHADVNPSALGNDELSRRRANAVAAELVALGIGRELITVEWRGDDDPISDGTTEDALAANRRVEVTIGCQ